MANSNSVFNRFSRYVGGGATEIADNKIEWWERIIFSTDPSDTEYVVDSFYEGRPDLISVAFYGEPRYWWVITQYNNIIDPIGEIVPGRVLRIPAKDRLELMVNTKQGGYASTKQSVNTITPVIT
jgi:hypothetical protein